MPWRRISAISSEVRFKLFPESKHGKSEISTTHTLCYTNKGNPETVVTSSSSSSSSLKISLPLFPPFLMKISSCGVKLNTFKISMQKCLHITYTDISPNLPFGFCYQHQFIELMCLQTVQILLPYWFTWVNEPLNKSRKTPFTNTKWLWHCVRFLMSSLHYIIVLRET